MSDTTKQALTDEQILAVRTALANAQWDLNLPAFCQALGIEQDYYAEELFRTLSQATTGLARFDATTFVKLVRLG